MTPDLCPNCGAAVPAGARACPGCGADERTGWSDAATAQRLGLPDDGAAFDHEDYAAREFGGRGLRRRGLPGWLIGAVAALLLLGLLAWAWG
jgi:RNA polymerase subunit RPABC4/transcription elongation factor Spt4